MMLFDKEKLVELAAANNAAWCEIVCSSHGATGQFDNAIWHSSNQVPEFYPNVVTLSKFCNEFTVSRVMRSMPAGAAVKDSFGNLNLAGYGFKQMFSAHWLMAGQCKLKPANYQLVKGFQGLRRWERAWGRGKSLGLFNVAILRHPDVYFVGICSDNTWLSGCVVNVGRESAGITNFFCNQNDQEFAWSGCLAAAREVAGDLPIFFYARDRWLATALSTGSLVIGELSVWCKEAMQ